MKNVLFFFLVFTFFSCKSQSGIQTAINADEFDKAIQKTDVQILDVRRTTEFTGGHIKNALQADWTNKEQFNERIKSVDKDKPVCIYCLAGSRSAAAAAWMRENGYKNVVELQGGINAWKSAGKPVEGLRQEKQMTMGEYTAAISRDHTTLVDVGATWCPPCVKMEPVIDELRKDKTLDFLFVKVDAGEQTALIKELNIEPIPVFIIYKKGKETWRKEGIVSKDELVKQLQ